VRVCGSVWLLCHTTVKARMVNSGSGHSRLPPRAAQNLLLTMESRDRLDNTCCPSHEFVAWQRTVAKTKLRDRPFYGEVSIADSGSRPCVDVNGSQYFQHQEKVDPRQDIQTGISYASEIRSCLFCRNRDALEVGRGRV